MLIKLLVALLVVAALVSSLGLAQPGASESPKQPRVPGAAQTRKQLGITDLFKSEPARKTMGLEKLSPEEQQHLANAIIEFAIPIRAMELRRSALRQEAVSYLTRQGWEEDPEKKMRQEGWEEVEVVGFTTIKGDRYTLDREVLIARVRGLKQYYTSQFQDELGRFDRANLRSGSHWGKDMFRSLTLIGLDGMEIELNQVDINNLP